MPSRGKKKTTMAKLNREARLRERRSEKAARKNARRDAATNESPTDLPDIDSDLPDVEEHTNAPATRLTEANSG
jgi:hypothetical protein